MWNIIGARRIGCNTSGHSSSQQCFTCFTTAKQIILISPVKPPFLHFISSYIWYGPRHHPPPPSQWSCPLPGFRLMTSDSPLRGASCLQSAVRLLVIIFQSVTLVSALWRWERREDEGPGWLDGWGGEREEGKGCDVWWWAVLCLCVFMCVDWSGGSGSGTQAVTALYCLLLSEHMAKDWRWKWAEEKELVYSFSAAF